MLINAPSIIPTHERVAALDRLGDEIAELSAHLEAATARLLDLIREFDARGGWNNGFTSCAAWLSWRVGLDPGAARERVRVARALGVLPRLAQALARGELSYAKVRALTRVATPETEERLLGVGRAGTASHVERIVRGWRQVDRRAEAREDALKHVRRGLHVYRDEDGMVVVRGRLAPEVGALLAQALTAARDTLYRKVGVSAETSPAPTMAQKQADALALLAETALHHGMDPGNSGERYQVVVHVDAPALAGPDQPGQSVLEDGTHVSAETSRRLACDASRLSCNTPETAVSWRWRPVVARFRPPCGARSTTETTAAASPAAAFASARAITSVTGPRMAPPRCPISLSCAVVITAPSMKRASSSIEAPMASCGSGVPMGGLCLMLRRRPECLMIQCTRSERETRPRG